MWCCVFAYVFVHRPNKENTGEVSESGASVVKHALNPEKPFMQVHYLKVRLIAQSTDSSGTWSFRLYRVALSLSLSFSGLLPLEVSGWSGWRRKVSALLQSVCGKIPRAAHSVSGECVLHGSYLIHLAWMQMYSVWTACAYFVRVSIVFQSHCHSISLYQWKNAPIPLNV